MEYPQDVDARSTTDFLQLLSLDGWEQKEVKWNGHLVLVRPGASGTDVGVYRPEDKLLFLFTGGVRGGRLYSLSEYRAAQPRPSAAAVGAPTAPVPPAAEAGGLGDPTASLCFNPLPASLDRPVIFTAAELMAMTLAPPLWVVDGLLPGGVALLAGKPKQGKSWLSLGLALAVARGGVALGRVPVAAGEVLYLALEDTHLRLQDRVRRLLAGAPPSDRLTLCTEWSRLAEGGLSDLETWMEGHPQTRLIIIDTLAKVRSPRRGNSDLFLEDYQVVNSLKSLADRYGIAVLVVHHLRKMTANDPFDTVSGTTGLTAAADATLLLQRVRGQAEATLCVTGRDVEERELALRWDAERCAWSLEGPAEEHRQSQERRAILRILTEAGTPLTPKETAALLNKAHPNVKGIMWKMARKGEITALGGGRYVPALPPHNPDHSHPAVNAENSDDRDDRRDCGNGGDRDDRSPSGAAPVTGGSGADDPTPTADPPFPGTQR